MLLQNWSNYTNIGKIIYDAPVMLFFYQRIGRGIIMLLVKKCYFDTEVIWLSFFISFLMGLSEDFYYIIGSYDIVGNYFIIRKLLHYWVLQALSRTGVIYTTPIKVWVDNVI